jgi:TetR/AcrR family transcriptional regulator, transcriptional repressor for nem operon
MLGPLREEPRRARVGRPKKYEREEILDRAMQTFWRHGFGATSTTDLEAHMGVNRYSVYAEFGSKQGLYEAALERYLSHVVPGFIGELGTPDAGLGAIEIILDRFASWAGAPGTEHGCMICNAATETSTDDPAARGFVQRYLATLEANLRHALDGAIARGELVRDLDSQAWSRKLTTTLIGMMVLIRARVDPATAQTAARVALDELRAQAPSPGPAPGRVHSSAKTGGRRSRAGKTR